MKMKTDVFEVESLFSLHVCITHSSSCHSAGGKDKECQLVCDNGYDITFATFETASRGVKVPPETAPAHPHPSHSFIGVPAPATAAFPPVQLLKVCLSPLPPPPSLPHVTCNPHHTTPR